MSVFQSAASILLILFMVMPVSMSESDMSCVHVSSSLSPCIPFGTGKVTTPADGCCSEIKSLDAAAKTTSDRQAICYCLKSLASVIPGINYKAVEVLPGKCGVKIPYRIHPSTDCKSVK